MSATPAPAGPLLASTDRASGVLAERDGRGSPGRLRSAQPLWVAPLDRQLPLGADGPLLPVLHQGAAVPEPPTHERHLDLRVELHLRRCEQLGHHLAANTRVTCIGGRRHLRQEAEDRVQNDVGQRHR